MNDVISQIVVKRGIFIEVSLAGGAVAIGSKYSWKFNDFLSKNDVLVYGIETVTVVEQTTSLTGRPIIPAADAAGLIINLVDIDGVYVFAEGYPSTRLRPALYNGYTQYFEPRKLDMTRSESRVVAVGGLLNTMSAYYYAYYKFKWE